MKIVYTELTETYIDGITELDRLCFTVPWSRNLFLSELHSNNAFYILALHNDRVIGYCGMDFVCGEGSITNIAVHPEYRKNGIVKIIPIIPKKISKSLLNGKYTFVLKLNKLSLSTLYLYFSFVSINSTASFIFTPYKKLFFNVYIS